MVSKYVENLIHMAGIMYILLTTFQLVKTVRVSVVWVLRGCQATIHAYR